MKEDLKTAFDTSGVLAGAKFAKDMGEGVKQVFEMERAFDRLNTRLGLSNKQLMDFKKNLGRGVAGTGQELKDILPGVETFAAKGKVRDAGQLANIGESLGKVRATTGEDIEGVADSVVEILKNQGKAITDQSVRSTLDAIQGTRTSGAFKTAGEAADAIQAITGSISPEQMKKMGIGTREIGGLAAMASSGGDQGQQILQSILKDATSAGGKDKLNAIFGQNIFKNGCADFALC